MDILEFRGKTGLSWTKHHMVDIHRKQLGYFQNESDDEHTVGWFKDDRNNYFLREMSLATLKDMVAIIQMELLPGCINKNNNQTVFGNQVWKNRFNIQPGTKYPVLAGLDAQDGNGFFADNAPVKDVNGSCPSMAVPISCFTDNEDDLNDDMHRDNATVVMPPPTEHLSDAQVEFQEDHYNMSREEMMVSEITETKDITDPDCIIDENDDFVGLIRKRGHRKEVESCKKMVRSLDRSGVPHPFKGEGFDNLVDFFEKSSIPLDLYTTRLSHLYATSNIYDQVRISSVQIAYRQDILAALAVKCDNDLEALNQVRNDMIAKVEHMKSLERKLLDTARSYDSTKLEVDEAARLLERNKSSTKKMLDEESEYEDSEFEPVSDTEDVYILNRNRPSRVQHIDTVVDNRRLKEERDTISPSHVSSRQQVLPELDVTKDPLRITRSSRQYANYPASPVDVTFSSPGGNAFGPMLKSSPTPNRRKFKHAPATSYVPRVTRAAAAGRETGSQARHKASVSEHGLTSVETVRQGTTTDVIPPHSSEVDSPRGQPTPDAKSGNDVSTMGSVETGEDTGDNAGGEHGGIRGE